MNRDALVAELVEDIERLGNSIAEFADRWSRYGEQLGHQLDSKQQRWVAEAFESFQRKLETIPFDDDWIRVVPVFPPARPGAAEEGAA